MCGCYCMKMRILHIAGGKGGARLAAESLVSAQNAHKELEAFIVSKEEVSSVQGLVSNILGKTYTYVQRGFINQPYEFMSTYSISNLSSDKIRSFYPDVVHIHNWFNLLGMDQLEQLGRKLPLVFTMHDQRLITGGCHVTYGCKNFTQGCNSCPAVKVGQGAVEKSKLKLEKILADFDNFGIISPSRWLMDDLGNSRISKNAKVVANIPNVIAPNFFQGEISQVIETPRNFKILFVAALFNEPLKGLDILIDAINDLIKKQGAKNLNVELSVVGTGNEMEQPDFKISYLGRLSSEELKALMSKLDLCVVPSRADNVPSVVIEAQLSGLAVLGSNIGGIPELISDNSTGLLCNPTRESIVLGIERFLALTDIKKANLRKNAREVASLRNSTSRIVQEHLNLYEALLK